MKNKIYILITFFLITFLLKSNAQPPQIVNWYRITAQLPPLNYNPTLTTNTFKVGYYNINPINGSQYIWNPGSSSWQPDDLFPSGTSGTGTTTNWSFGPYSNFNGDLTLSPERFGAIHENLTFLQKYPNAAQRNQIINYLNYHLTYDTAGCTGGVPNSPLGAPANCFYYTSSGSQSWINAIGGPITASDNVDWAAWQVCIKIALQRGQSKGSLGIVAKGGARYYIGNRAIVIASPSVPNVSSPSPPGLKIDGNYCTIITNGITGPFYPGTTLRANAIFYRETRNLASSGVGESIMFPFFIENMTLEGTSSDIGIAIGPTYSAYYSGIKCKNFSTAIHVRFGLRTTIKNCIAYNCRNGFILDIGNWPNGSQETKQSNVSTISSCLYENLTPNGGDTAFSFRVSSGCVVENSIIRATRLLIGISNNTRSGELGPPGYYLSANVRDFTVNNVEFDVDQITNSAIFLRVGHNGINTINNVKSSKPALMIKNNFEGTGGAEYFTIVVSNISRWVGLNTSSGVRYFENNQPGIRWVFRNNDDLLHPLNNATVIGWFRGTAINNLTNCTPTTNQFPGFPPGCAGGNNTRYASYPMPR